MTTIASLLIQLGIDPKGVTTGSAQAQRGVAGLSQTITQGIGIAGPLAYAAAAGAALKFGKDAVMAASNVEEQLNKTRQVFGQSADSVISFSETSAESFGISQAAALEAAGSFGAMLDSAGVVQSASADMSTALVELASDMASFNNADPSEMLERLRSGLAGEAEPLRRFGVFLSEARTKAEAYASGIATVGAELTEAQKIQARYNLIFQDTARQQGDFARTQDSLANTLRTLQAQWDDLLATLGRILLPVVTDVIGAMRPLLDLVETLTPAIELAARAFGYMISPLATLIRMLPDFGGQFAELGKDLARNERLVGLLEERYEQTKAVLEVVARNTEDYRGVAEDFIPVLTKQATEVQSLKQRTEALANAEVAAAEAAREQREAILSLSDSFIGIIDSANAVAEAQRELNRLERQGKTDTKAYEGAVVDAIEKQITFEDQVISLGQELADSGATMREVKEKVRELASGFESQGGVVRDLIARVQEYVDELYSIPDTITTRFTIDYVQHGRPPAGVPSGSPALRAAASGFDGLVTSPTLFLAGEAGPEWVNVTPSGAHELAAGGGSGPGPGVGRTVVINNGTMIGTSPEDLARLLDEQLTGRDRYGSLTHHVFERAETEQQLRNLDRRVAALEP